VTETTLSIVQDAEAAAAALEVLISKNNKSGNKLLKDPRFSTDEGWHLCLPEHFNTSLDIKYIWKQKVQNKVVVHKWKEWAQGSSFCFNEGAIIYNVDVSGMKTWGEKLDAIDFYVVLGPTRPVSFRADIDIGGAANGTKKNRIERDPGSVRFKIFEPTNDHRSVLTNEHTVSQDEFVRFAITGSF
jgi:hypothetical protein